MNKDTNNKPQIRLADGYEERAAEGHEEPIILLTLGDQQTLLSSEDAMKLAYGLTSLQGSFLGYSLAIKRCANAIAQTDVLEVADVDKC